MGKRYGAPQRGRHVGVPPHSGMQCHPEGGVGGPRPSSCWLGHFYACHSGAVAICNFRELLTGLKNPGGRRSVFTTNKLCRGGLVGQETGTPGGGGSNRSPGPILPEIRTRSLLRIEASFTLSEIITHSHRHRDDKAWRIKEKLCRFSPHKKTKHSDCMVGVRG